MSCFHIWNKEQNKTGTSSELESISELENSKKVNTNYFKKQKKLYWSLRLTNKRPVSLTLWHI